MDPLPSGGGDSIAFKVCYAFGLRRREVTMLELADFGPNPHVSAYAGFGAVIAYSRPLTICAG